MKREKRTAHNPRAYAGKLAREAIASGKPLDWFERLYAEALSDGADIPWADRTPNPNVIELFERISQLSAGSSAGRVLVIGCGLGDDAEWFAGQGFAVTAFDISPSAISECRNRFPASRVSYQHADLFAAPSSWNNAFDIVLEAYTLQVLPESLRSEAIAAMCRFVATGGYLLFIARGREETEPEGTLPWPLLKKETEQFSACGLQERCFEDYLDRSGSSAVRRFRACYQRS